MPNLLGWHIDRFGHFFDTAHDTLGPGLNVLYGPNEAGKSTLLQFIAWVLFGTVGMSRHERDLAERAAGSLRMTTGDGGYILARKGRAVSITGPDGQSADPSALIGHVDRRLFRAVYAFDLSDLAGLADLDSDTLKERLYGAATTGGGRPVSEVRAELEKELAALWRPRASCTIRDLHRDLKAAEGALRDAQRAARHLPDREAIVTTMRAEASALLGRRKEAARTAARRTALIASAPTWATLQGVEERLRDLPEARLDAATWSALQQAELAVTEARARHADATERLDDARVLVDALAPPDPVLDHRTTLERLDAERASVEAAHERAIEARAGLPEAERVLTAHLDAVGLDEDAACALRPTAEQLGRLREDGRSLTEAHRRIEAEREPVAERAARLAGEVERLERDLDALATDPVAAEALPEARALAASWRAETADLADALPSLRQGAEQARAAARAALAPLGVDTPDDLPDLDPRATAPLMEQCDTAARDHASAVARHTDAERALGTAQQERDAAATALADAPDPGRHAAHAASIRDLAARIGPALSARDAAALAREAREAALETLARQCEVLGRTPDALPATPPNHADQQALAERCAAVRTAEHEAAAHARALRDTPPSDADPAELDALVARKEALAHAEGLLRDAERRADDANAPRVPWGPISAAVLIGALGAVGLGAGLVLGAPLITLLGGAALLAALGIALGAVWWQTRGASPADPRRREALHAGLTALGLPTDAGHAAIGRERERVERALAEAQRAASRERTRLHAEESRGAAHAAQAALRAWLGEHGLPAELSASVAERWVGTLTDALEARAAAARATREQSGHRAEWEAFLDRAAALLDALEADYDPSDPTTAMHEARTALATSEASAAERHRLAEALEAAERRLGSAAALCEQTARARDGLAATLHTLREALRERAIPAEVEAASRWVLDAREARRATAAAAGAARRLDEAEQAVARWEARRDALRRALDTDATLDAIVARCEEASTVARHAEQIAARLRSKREEQEASTAALASLDRRADQRDLLVRQWEALRDAAGVPPSISPEGIGAFLDALEHAQTASTQHRALLQTIAQIARRADAFVAEVTALCTALALPEVHGLDEAAHRVRALTERLADALRQADARAALESTLRAAAATVKARSEHLQEQSDARDAALDACALASYDDARAAWDDTVERERLEQERRGLLATIEARLGPLDADTRALLDQADVAAWSVERDDAERSRADLDATHEERTKAIGIEESALATLKQRADVIERANEVEALRDALREATHAYLTLQTTDRLLADALERFKQERQPGVLRRASALWERVTHGAWVGVRPAVEDEALEVLDRHGHVARPERLSRGTAEQLYLCLRLALAEALADGGASALPLVLDDVLVNFDRERATACAEVLAEVAQARQVLLFTCRDTSVAALQHADPGATVIRLPRFGGRDRAAGPPTAPRSGDTSRVHDLLREATEPLAAAEIASMLSLDRDVCKEAIRTLREGGTVVKIGRKRGTRYTLAARGHDHAQEGP